jgi:putative heme-binding domain-containing protein
MRPGYQVVQMQQRQPRQPVAIESVKVAADRRQLVVTSAPRTEGVNYILRASGDSAAVLPAGMATDLHGLAAEWRNGSGAASWTGWLPHPDLAAARQFTRASGSHGELWSHLDTPGTLVLRGKADLANWLQPPTQPGADLGYEPAPERVTLVFRSDAALSLEAEGAGVERVSGTESRLVVDAAAPGVWPAFTLTVATPMQRLDVAGLGDRDGHERAPGVRRFWLPFAKPAAEVPYDREIPELSGGDWKRGRDLFRGKAACFTCHVMRGEGSPVGPDLNNLVHRDYASVLRDIVEPGAVINPDAVGYTVTLKSGGIVVGTNAGEDATVLKIAQPGGQVATVEKNEVAKVEALPASLMPAGIDKTLTNDELRDLMTYLLTEAAE